MSTEFGSNSETVFKLYCGPCNHLGEHLEAFGYCDDCKEHLCVSCYKFHCRPTPLRNHRLLDKENMPQQMTEKSVDQLSDTCHLHITSTVTHYCKSHDQLCCQVCVAVNHHMCKDVDYIPDIASDVVKTEEYKDFVQTITDLLVKVDETQAKCKEHLVISESLKNQAKAEIKRFAKEIVDLFKRLESEIDEEAEEVCRILKNVYDTLSGRLGKLKTELDRSKNVLDQMTEKNMFIKLFIAFKRERVVVESFAECVQAVIEENKRPMYRFVSKPEIKLLKDSIKRIGIISRREAAPKLSFVAEFSVNVDTESTIGMITSAEMIDCDHLVLCDANNEKVILIDINKRTVLHELPMECRDIALGQGGEIVVTQPEQRRLCFLTTVNNLLVDTQEELTVKDEPKGIVCSHGRFIITVIQGYYDSYYSSSEDDEYVYADYFIRCLERTGQVVWSVNTTDEIRFIGLSACNNILYVSYSELNIMDSINVQDGTTVDTYKHDKLKRPTGITTDIFGNIYVCSSDNSTIHILDTKRNTLCVFMDNTSRLKHPQNIAYSDKYDKLIVTMAYCNKIAIFELS